MVTPNKWVVTAALVLALAGPARAASLAADEQMIRDLDVRWVGVVAAKDAAATAGFYAEDGVLMPPGSPPQEGREAIAAAWSGLFALPGFSLTFWPTRIVIAASADVAWEIGAYNLAYDGDGGPVNDKGKYVVAWRKVDGIWQVGADIFNTNGPAQ